MTTDAPQSAPESGAAKAPKYHPCKCMLGTGNQCTGETTKAFARGHDARMASRLAGLVADGKMPVEKAEKLVREAGGGDLLVSKMVHSAKLRQEAKAKPAKDKATPKAKAPAKDKAADKAPANGSGNIVGRELPVSHGERQFKGTVIRNASGDLKIRHRFQGKDCDHDMEV